MNVKRRLRVTLKLLVPLRVAGQRVNLPDRERPQFVGILHGVKKREHLPQFVHRVGRNAFGAALGVTAKLRIFTGRL